MPADTEWHYVSFMSDGSRMAVICDGKQIRTGAAQSIPDGIDISNSQDMTVSCHQEGVWVRSITFSPIGPMSRMKFSPSGGAKRVSIGDRLSQR